MITEDYVSFETAKLLKEKGFDAEGVSEFGGFYIDYYHTGKNVGIATESMMLNKDLDCWEYLRPTLQMAMKWLREQHNIILVILIGGYTVTPPYYWFRIDKINDGKWEDSVYRDETKRNTYEEACEAAIKYCLKNLI